LSFYLLCLFFDKIEEQEGTGLGGRGCWNQWEGGGGREKGRRMNTCNQCIHIYVDAKRIPAETVAGIRGGGMKDSSEGNEFKCDIFDTL
jgi:hypothetical protein